MSIESRNSGNAGRPDRKKEVRTVPTTGSMRERTERVDAEARRMATEAGYPKVPYTLHKIAVEMTPENEASLQRRDVAPLVDEAKTRFIDAPVPPQDLFVRFDPKQFTEGVLDLHKVIEKKPPTKKIQS